MKKIKATATAKVNSIHFPITFYAAVSIDSDNGSVKVAAISTAPLDSSVESDFVYLSTDEHKIDRTDSLHSGFGLEQPVWDAIENRVASMIRSGEYAEAAEANSYDLEI